MNDILVQFDSIHDVIAAEKEFRKSGIPCDLIPAPREVTSDCGMLLVAPLEQRESILARLGLGDLRYRQLFRRDDSGIAPLSAP